MDDVSKEMLKLIEVGNKIVAAASKLKCSKRGPHTKYKTADCFANIGKYAAEHRNTKESQQ